MESLHTSGKRGTPEWEHIVKKLKAGILALKQSDFSWVELLGDEEVLKAEVGDYANLKARIDIYYSKNIGYFPILRHFRSDGSDIEMDIYKSLSDTKKRILAELL